MIAGVMAFGLVTFILSFFISKRTKVCEKGEMATYVALVAWGSLMFGLFMSKFTI